MMNPAGGGQNIAFRFLQVSPGCTVFSPQLLIESVTMVKIRECFYIEVLLNFLIDRLFYQLA